MILNSRSLALQKIDFLKKKWSFVKELHMEVKKCPNRFFIEKSIFFKDDVGNFQNIWMLKQDTKASPNSRGYIYWKFKELFENLFLTWKNEGFLLTTHKQVLYIPLQTYFFHQKNQFFQRQGKLVPNRLNPETRPQSRSEYDRISFLKV